MTSACISLSIVDLKYVYIVPLLTHSASNIGVTLKYGLGVIQGHWKWRRSIDDVYDLLLVNRCKYSSIFCAIFELFDVE